MGGEGGAHGETLFAGLTAPDSAAGAMIPPGLTHSVGTRAGLADGLAQGRCLRLQCPVSSAFTLPWGLWSFRNLA